MIFACTFIYILMFCTTCRYEKTSMARECNNKRPHENIYIYILIYIYTHTENFIYNITISIPQYVMLHIIQIYWNALILMIHTLTLVAILADTPGLMQVNFHSPLLQVRSGRKAMCCMHRDFQHFSRDSHHVYILQMILIIKFSFLSLNILNYK